MSDTTHDHGHDSGSDPRDGTHAASWSANLETPAYADDPERVTTDAVRAVENTRPGYHVNLVTHGANGHPETYLYGVLEDEFGARVDYEFVEQCGCGGYVTRVHVRD